MRGHRRPDVRDGDTGGSDGDGHRDGQEQEGPSRAPQQAAAQDARPGARPDGGRTLDACVRGVSGVRHPASPNERSPAATRSTPSTVRMVGFIA